MLNMTLELSGDFQRVAISGKASQKQVSGGKRGFVFSR
jgi:hypothetical protein